jgi:hypothetical protein
MNDMVHAGANTMDPLLATSCEARRVEMEEPWRLVDGQESALSMCA